MCVMCVKQFLHRNADHLPGYVVPGPSTLPLHPYTPKFGE
jgi:hypothetical protein